MLAQPIIRAQTDGVAAGYYFYDLNGKREHRIELPGIGSIGGPIGLEDEDEAYFSFERSWVYPYNALLLLDDRKKVPLLLSALALSYQTLLKPDTGASAA